MLVVSDQFWDNTRKVLVSTVHYSWLSSTAFCITFPLCCLNQGTTTTNKGKHIFSTRSGKVFFQAHGKKKKAQFYAVGIHFPCPSKYSTEMGYNGSGLSGANTVRYDFPFS